MPINPFVNSNNFQSSNQTSYDVENPQPLGGPNSFPQYNHQHQFTPNNTYLDTRQEEASPNSDFGINGTTLSTQNIFNKIPNGTSLDVENKNPNGGPNRTNAGAYNIPSGQYTNIGSSGTLFNNDGTIAITKVHQYLPSTGNKYENSFSPGTLSPQSTF
jgi:hypothetical protein